METALKLWDFGDSGAFAELHVPQYPGGLGDPAREKQLQLKTMATGNAKAANSNTSRTTHDANSNNQSSALMIVQTGQSSLIASKFTAEDLAKPDEQALQQLQEQTQRDLEAARARAAASAGGSVSVGKQQHGTSAPTTSVINVDGRTIAVTEVAQDVSYKRTLQLQKIGAAEVADQLRETAPLVRSPTRKLTAQESAAFAVPAAVYASRNPKSKLISIEERERHDGRNYVQHTVSSAHADAAKAMAEASAQAEADERARARDAEREKAKRKEEERAKLIEQAQQSLARTLASAGGNNSNSNNAGSGSAAVDTYQDRSREMQERRKLHALQRTADSLGIDVDVAELLAQDEDVEVEVVNSSYNNNNKNGKVNNNKSLGGTFDSRLGYALSHGEGDFVDPSQLRTGVVNSGLSSVIENVSRDKLEQEQRLQMAMGRVAGQTVDGKAARNNDDDDEDDVDDDDDDDVFGVGKLLPGGSGK